MAIFEKNILTSVSKNGVVLSELVFPESGGKYDFEHKDVYLKELDIGTQLKFDQFHKNIFYAVSDVNTLYSVDLHDSSRFVASRALGSFKPMSMAVKTLGHDTMAVINDEGVIDM